MMTKIPTLYESEMRPRCEVAVSFCDFPATIERVVASVSKAQAAQSLFKNAFQARLHRLGLSI